MVRLCQCHCGRRRGQRLCHWLCPKRRFPYHPRRFSDYLDQPAQCPQNPCGDAFVSKLTSAPSYPSGDHGKPEWRPGNSSWYLGAVTVTLTATDSGSPVSATYYSVDVGPYRVYDAPSRFRATVAISFYFTASIAPVTRRRPMANSSRSTPNPLVMSPRFRPKPLRRTSASNGSDQARRPVG